MLYDYNSLYAQNPHALGEATPEIMAFFKAQPHRNLHVLDVGCGQGRDAIPITRMGFSVTGIDIAHEGIRQINVLAQNELLKLEGIVADVASFQPEFDYDVVIFDRILHLLAPRHRTACFSRLIQHVKATGWVLINDERRNMSELEGHFTAQPQFWSVKYQKKGILFAQRSVV